MSVRFATAATNQTFSCLELGWSDESQYINFRLWKISAETRRPISLAWREDLLDDLDEILQSCSRAGWDGYDAEPVSLESVVSVHQVINALPDHINVPSVVPEPDGEIALEWRNGDQKYFSVSVSARRLAYAGIFGGVSKKYGEERFFGTIPAAIVDILTRYFSEA